jgi:hypothetical protein
MALQQHGDLRSRWNFCRDIAKTKLDLLKRCWRLNENLITFRGHREEIENFFAREMLNDKWMNVGVKLEEWIC